jgi:hypothetical protein
MASLVKKMDYLTIGNKITRTKIQEPKKFQIKKFKCAR